MGLKGMKVEERKTGYSKGQQGEGEFNNKKLKKSVFLFYFFENMCGRIVG